MFASSFLVCAHLTACVSVHAYSLEGPLRSRGQHAGMSVEKKLGSNLGVFKYPSGQKFELTDTSNEMAVKNHDPKKKQPKIVLPHLFILPSQFPPPFTLHPPFPPPLII